MNPSRLTVDLDALTRNLLRLRDAAGGRALIPAVKANAYGHGLVEVSRHIEPLVAMLGVAAVDEATALRAAGITKPILKFSPTLPDELDAAAAACLTLTVSSLDDVHAASDSGHEFNVHLKIDTGMRRVGVQIADAVEAARAIVAAPNLTLEGLLTHLAVADEPDGEDFTRAQLASFQEAVAAVEQAVGKVKWVHAANSAGILDHDLSGTNAVRPGIAMYGSAPGMEPVATWTSRVTLVKELAAGEAVSYGLTWRAPRKTRVATVAIGYGDGYSRLNSNRGRVLIDGSSYPIVGRVCMDQTLVDLGPDSQIQTGAEVVLMGQSGDETITVQEIADLMGTITYEVTCLISPRVTRVYPAL